MVRLPLPRTRWLQQLVSTLEQCGYRYFKVSHLIHGAVGPLGDKASDWRLGLAWRNASSVLGDSMALPGVLEMLFDCKSFGFNQHGDFAFASSMASWL